MSKELIGTIIANKTGPEIEEALRDNADEVLSEQTYNVPISHQEKEELTKQFAEEYEKAEVIAEKLKEHNKKKRTEIKELKASVRENSKIISKGFRRMDGNIFIFRDYENNTAFEYNSQGILINERKLRANEKQASILNLSQTGTN